MSTVLHHRIQDSQLLAHTGYQGYFLGLSCGQQSFVHGCNISVDGDAYKYSCADSTNIGQLSWR
jgi:hypothetical protein